MKFQNPVLLNDPERKDRTADPHVLWYNGKYYHTYMANDALFVAEMPSLSDFDSAERREHLVFDGENLEKHFAPELHFLDGDFYIYAAPCYKGSETHFVCVYKSEDKTPTGRYAKIGAVEGIGEAWGIDATVFSYKGARYMVYTTCKEMYIAKMKSPTAIEGTPVGIKRPERDWETVMSGVVEGPAVIFDGETPVLVYSASDSKCDDYCLGMMRMEGEDPLEIAAWVANPTPVLTKKEGMFGPGHCSFTEAEGELYCVYHANLVSGSGWGGRSVFIKHAWFKNGVLYFE